MEKVNPYNQNNKFITSNDIINIMETLNINNFKVNNILLYQTAFIHKSYCKELYEGSDFKNIDESMDLQDKSYETMEFLGDSILGSIISSYLYERFYTIYDQNEGFLTYLKNRLVCGDMNAYLSSKLGFNKYLIISKHIEDNCDGRNNKNILNNVFESFLGAVFLDNDYEFTKNILLTIVEKYVDFTDIILFTNNYKEQIIKYLQHNYKENPKYKDIDSIDDIYSCELIFKDEIISRGQGKSKKEAQQNASKNALHHYNVLN